MSKGGGQMMSASNQQRLQDIQLAEVKAKTDAKMRAFQLEAQMRARMNYVDKAFSQRQYNGLLNASVAYGAATPKHVCMTSGCCVVSAPIEYSTASYAVNVRDAEKVSTSKPRPKRSPLGLDHGWRFDSPFAPLRKRWVRFIWSMTRTHRRL